MSVDKAQFTALVASKTGHPVKHIEDVRVIEEFRGQTVWDGIVSLFESNSGRCFAWIDPDSSELVVVDKRPPVEKPVDAVRAYIVGKT